MGSVESACLPEERTLRDWRIVDQDGRPTRRPSAADLGLTTMAVLLTMFLAACSASTDRRLVEGFIEEGDTSFYTPPNPTPAGTPGEIVRTERLLSAPDGTNAWRVLYHTTDVMGADIIVSGVVIAPDDAAPAGGRTVVGWGHPTTGAAAKCAPSNGVDPFDLIEGMRPLLAAGYVISYADYPGLGVEGQSSYLIGTSEGNSVLDAVRAARNIPETGAGSDVLLWGHSQGGQAVLFAGQDAKSYAPELAGPRASRSPRRPPISPPCSTTTSRTPPASRSGPTPSPPSNPSTPRSIPGCRSTSILTDAGAAATPGMAATVPARPTHRAARPGARPGRQLHPQRSGDHRAVGHHAGREHPGRNTSRGSAVRRTGRDGRLGAAQCDAGLRDQAMRGG